MMDEDEETRLIADNPGYPVAVVPTQSSRTAEFSWTNNKITLGSRPVQTETKQDSTLNPADTVDKENLCKHCNIEFVNNNLLIKHLLGLLSTVKQPAKRKIEKEKVPKQSPKKSEINDTIIKRKKYSSAAEKNSNIRSQCQVESSTGYNEHLTQQTSSTNVSSASDNTSNKIQKLRLSLENNKDIEKVQKLAYIYKCKLCNTYFGNKRQMKQHKVSVHPELEDIFVKLPISKKRNKTEHKVLNVKLRKVTAPKKEKKIHRNEHISSMKTLLYRPEVKENLSMQNRAGPSWQPDTVNQTTAIANPLIKKQTVSKPAPKKNPIKKIQKESTLNNHKQTHNTVRVINSEKTELFKSNCGLHFITCKSLQKHSDVCNGSCNTPKIICKKCGYIFPSDILPLHQSKHHNVNQINVFDIVELSQKQKILQCISCTQKFTYKKSYQTHVLKCKYKIRTQNLSNQKVLYKCCQCNVHYTTRVGLTNHLRKDHSIRYAIKKCDDCNILLSNRSFQHHIQIHHSLFECELKDLTIKYVDDKMQNEINTSESQTIKTVGQSLSSDNTRSFNKSDIIESLSNTTESNISTKDNVVPEITNANNISMTNKISKEPTYKPTGILPNVLYKCNKCEVHFVTNTSHNDHISSKNCRKSNESDIGKCPKCQLVFYTDSVIEHLANQHLDKFKTSNDFLIIYNDTGKIQSHCKANDSITEEHVQSAKRYIGQSYNEEPAPIRNDTNVQNINVYDKAESVKLFAEAWIRNKCTKTLSFATIDPTCFSNFLYRCIKCTLNFLKPCRLKIHISECKGDSLDWAQCPICCYSFAVSSLTLHIYVHHAKMELKRENFVIKSSESCMDSLGKLKNRHMTPKTQSATTENIIVNKHAEEKCHQSKTDSLLKNFEATDDIGKEATVTETSIDSNTNLPNVFDLVSSHETEDAEATDSNDKEVTAAAEKYINATRNSPDVIDLVSSQETKDVLLSDFKSSRAKIAWAIDSIEDSNMNNGNKSPKGWNVEVKESSRETITTINETSEDLANDETLIRETPTKTKETSNKVEKDVSEEIDSILSALNENSKEQTKVNSITSYNQITDTEEDIQTNKVFEDIDILVASFDKNPKATRKQQQNAVLYKCNVCSIHFMTSQSLQIHILNGVHSEDLGTNCNLCHLTFNKHTVTKHITKHHKQMNVTPLNYTIKTNYRADSTIKKQQVVSEFFNKKQHNENILKYAENMLGLTRKQKSSLCKVLKRSGKNNTTGTEVPGSSKQIQNPILNQLLNTRETNEKQQDVNNYSVNKGLQQQNHKSNMDIPLTNSTTNNTTLVHSSNTNLEIIDLSDSQNLEIGGKIVTDPTPQFICTKNAQSPYKRTFSVDSNVTNYKNTTITKSRTKSEDQRESNSHTDPITYKSFDSSKIVRKNTNTVSGNRTEKVTAIVTENANGSSESSKLMAPSRFQLNGVNITPVNSKGSADIDTKAKHNSIVQNTSAKSKRDKKKSTVILNSNSPASINFQAIAKPPSLNAGNVVSLKNMNIIIDTTENQNENSAKNMSEGPTKHALKNTFGKSTVPKKSTSSKHTGLTPDETKALNLFSQQNCQKSKRVNSNTPHSPATTDSSCIKKPDTFRRPFITFEDSHFEIGTSCETEDNTHTTAPEKVNTEDHKKREKLKGKSSSSVATPPRIGFSSVHRKEPVDIIDITEETNDNNTHIPGTDRTKNFNAEHSKASSTGDFDLGQNKFISTSTISASVSNTPMVFPSAPNFNLFDFMNDPVFQYLSLPFSQQSGYNINPNHTKPQQNKKRVTNKPSAPRVPTIFDNMQSCPICRSSSDISSIKQHLKVRKGFFSCCFCARKSAELELNKHIQICGSQINFNSLHYRLN